MAAFLLDSDAVIDYLQGMQPATQMIQDLYSRGDALCTSDVVVCEVYSGLSSTESPRAEELLDSLRFLQTSRHAARQAGQWRHLYRRSGKHLPVTDTLIAATALDHRATIITANISDYPMPEVTILPLARPTR